MKNLYQIFILALFGAGSMASLSAQQIPNFVGQYQHPALFNPARMGEGIIGVNYRQQWLGLEGEDAPRSFYLLADISHLARLRDKKIGLGLQFLGDRAHILNTTRISLDFAYHLIDQTEQRLSAGIRAGYATQSLEFGDVRVNDPFDLELFSGSTSGGSLDGGPGIAYYRRMASGGGLNLDLSLLQLFADRLEQDNGSFFDWQRHLVARASYRAPVADGLTLEPVLVYRQAVDEFQLKDDVLEVAVRAGFQDRFSLTAGTRLGAQTYFLGFGLDLGNAAPVGVNAAYETDDIFGGSYEVGLSYFTGREPEDDDFTDNDPASPPETINPPRPPRERPDRTSDKDKRKVDYALYRANLEDILEGVPPALASATDASTEAASLLSRINQPSTPIEGKRSGLSLVVNELDKAGTLLTTVRTGLNRAGAEIANARAAGGGAVITDRRMNRTISQVADLRTRYQALENKLSSLRSDYSVAEASIAPSVLASIRTGNLEQVQTYFSRKMAGVQNLPPNFGPVEVTRSNGGIRVSLPFAKSTQYFDVKHPDNNDVLQLVNVLAGELRQLRSNGIQLEGITLLAQLRDPLEDQLLDDEAGNYAGELGTSAVSFEYTFRNPTSGTTNLMPAVISTGYVDFIELTALKLESMRRQLSVMGLPRNQISLEIAAPVNQQGQERYSIVVVLRP